MMSTVLGSDSTEGPTKLLSEVFLRVFIPKLLILSVEADHREYDFTEHCVQVRLENAVHIRIAQATQ